MFADNTTFLRYEAIDAYIDNKQIIIGIPIEIEELQKYIDGILIISSNDLQFAYMMPDEAQLLCQTVNGQLELITQEEQDKYFEIDLENKVLYIK